MDPADGPERVALTVPLAAVGSSSRRRTRLAVAIWTIGLAGIAWLGLAGHDGQTAVPGLIAAVPAAEQATTAPSVAPAQAGDPAPPIVTRRPLGEDGLMGGFLFGHRVPSLSQADIERDGYRYYQALITRDPDLGRQGSP